MPPRDCSSFLSCQLRDALPFGNKAAVIVLNGGSAFTLKSGTLTPSSFNHLGATNEVLYP
jgi:hypothetical protein